MILYIGMELDWIVTRSPITWWEIGAVGASDFTFTGPGFTGAAQDPTIYVMRGIHICI